jgi:hypothetical protein
MAQIQRIAPGLAFGGRQFVVSGGNITTFTLSALLVGGGGGGGVNGGGGGGGGGVLSAINLSTTTSIQYTVIIGNSGGTGISTTGVGYNGGNTIFSTLTAIGGGGGGGDTSVPTTAFVAAMSGGSGGGAAASTIQRSGAAGIPGQGYAGGNNSTSTYYSPGGGGGAGGVGSNGTPTVGGNGGPGVSVTFNGTSFGPYGGGGGAGNNGGGGSNGNGGSGGGGAGGGGNGTANTGGGGGGSASTTGAGNGGTGVAILASPYVAAVSSLSGSPTITALTGPLNYSGSFNGSNNLSLNNIALESTSIFTVEAWVYCTSFNAGSQNTIIGTRPSVSGTVGWEFRISTSGLPQFYFTGGSSLNTSSTVLSLNTWTHLAVTRNGANAYLYINGILSLSSSSFANGSNSGISTYIGIENGDSPSGFRGYISNLRVTNTALYTSAFTPSTVPLTAITGTQLLTLQNASIVDNSTNAYTITNNSSVTTTSSIQPFTNTNTIVGYAYTFNNNGYLTYTNNTFLNYAASFNGSNQYLTLPGSGTIFGTNNFTVECWVYLTATQQFQYIFDARDSSHTNNWCFGWGLATTAQLSWFYGASVVNDSSTTDFTTNTWYHVAYVRNNNVGTLYRNGTSVGTGTDTNNYNIVSTTNTIGARYNNTASSGMTGYISNMRIVNGIGLYTSNFTPPTTHLTAIAGTQLLTCQNATLVDNSTNNFTITNNGSVTTTYTTVPFNY